MQTLSVKIDPAFEARLAEIQRGLEELRARPKAQADADERGPWLTAREMMERLRVGRTTLWRMAQDGRVERKDYGGRIVRYRERVC